MKIVYSATYRECERYLGVSEDETSLAINDFSSKKIIPTGGKDSRILFLRRVTNGTWILVDGMWYPDGKKYEIKTSFRLFDRTVEEARSNDPLILLQHLVMIFGEIMTAGDQQNRFIFQSVFQIYSDAKSFDIQVTEHKKGHKVLISTGHRTFRTSQGQFADVHLAYAMDLDRYRDYVKENMADISQSGVHTR